MKRPLFFVGTHKPSHAGKLPNCMVSVNVLQHRKGDFNPSNWVMDSGAFSRVTSGIGHMDVADYAAQIGRWKRCGNLMAAVAQDYMCEPFVLEKTGLTVGDHQAMTIERCDALRALVTDVYIMPVLQGYQPGQYVDHLRRYGNRLQHGAWVGVGSLCRRNGNPVQAQEVLASIHRERPDLLLHGFGLKLTALRRHAICELLHSCDSMAWSLAARNEGRNANSVTEALCYTRRIAQLPIQLSLDVLVGDLGVGVAPVTVAAWP